MKKIAQSFLAITLIITSCTENINKTDVITNKTEKQNIVKAEDTTLVVESINVSDIGKTDTEIEALIIAEGIDVDDEKYKDFSQENIVSDCFIVSNFVDMDINYITVDLVNYRLDEDSKHSNYEVYDLVNVKKELRTFMIMDEFKTCNKKVVKSFNDLIQISKDKPKSIFSLARALPY